MMEPSQMTMATTYGTSPVKPWGKSSGRLLVNAVLGTTVTLLVGVLWVETVPMKPGGSPAIQELGLMVATTVMTWSGRLKADLQVELQGNQECGLTTTSVELLGVVLWDEPTMEPSQTTTAT
jgi:hypothetical protein